MREKGKRKRWKVVNARLEETVGGAGGGGGEAERGGEQNEEEGQKQEDYRIKGKNKGETRGTIFQIGSAYIYESDLLMEQINKAQNAVTQMNWMFSNRQQTKLHKHAERHKMQSHRQTEA